MAMKSLDDIDRVLFSSWSGPNHLVQELVGPFLEDVHAQASSSGFRESLAGFDVPSDLFPSSKKYGETAVFEPASLLIGLSIFLGTSIGAWAVDQVCDEIFKNKVRPAFKRLTKKLRKEIKQRPFRQSAKFTFGVWYDVDRVYVHVVANFSTPEQLEEIEELIPVAQRAALAWIDQHGVTNQVLTYRIHHGELSQRPMLSNSVPEG